MKRQSKNHPTQNFVLFIAAIVTPVLFMAGYGPAQDASSKQDIRPDLVPLKGYLGEWESEFRIIGANANESPNVYRGKVSGKWSVGGQFLEQSGSYYLNDSQPPLKIKTLMAFNKDDGDFDFYYFYSSGQVFKSKASWDSSRKIMTSIRSDGKSGDITEIIADFSKPHVESWKILIKDSSSNVKLKIEGTNRKLKPKKKD